VKRQAYRLFEIVAWPAAVWYAVEAAIRGATGDAAGAAWALLFAAMASAMIGGCRMASRGVSVPAR